jgi:hypothetical protein
MYRKLLFGLILVFGLILSACQPAEGELPQTGGTQNVLPPQAALEAQRILSEQLGVNVADIEIVQVEQMEWPNACLGLAEEGEACAEVVTPGFQVTMEVNGQPYVFRTDEAGQVVRQVLEGQQ